jgi:RHS repeat-associated protein
VTTTAYDAAGETTAVTSPLGFITNYAYDAAGRQTTVTDPLGFVTTTAYDRAGQVTAVTDARGFTTAYGYDPAGQQTTATDPLGFVTTTAYDKAGQVTAVTDVRGFITAYAFDAAGRPTTVTDPLGNVTTMAYDKAGETTAVTNPLGHTANYGYDAAGRQTTVTDPMSFVTTTAYDKADEVTAVTDPLGRTTNYGYDAAGRRTTVTDPLTKVTTTGYDNAGNVTSVVDPDTNHTTYSYDAAGRKTQLSDALGTSTFAYDANDRMTATTDHDGRVSAFAYDADGRNTAQTWFTAAGATMTYLTFTYDNDGNQTGNSRQDVGGANYAYTFTYDNADRMVRQQGPFGFSLTFTLDQEGNVTLVQDSAGRTTTSTFDGDNRLLTRSLSEGPGLRYDYNADGTVRDLYRLWNGTTAGYTTYNYDAGGRVTVLDQVQASGATLTYLTYAYDAASQVTSEAYSGPTTTTLNTYAYDVGGELTTVNGAVLYGYDANGNPNPNPPTSVGAGNELTNDGTWTYTYDAEGNETSKSQGATSPSWSYTYDNADHLIMAVEYNQPGGTAQITVTYGYDAMGNVVSTTSTWPGHVGPATWYEAVVNGEVYADITKATLQPEAYYLRGADGDNLVARALTGTFNWWYLTDRLGTIRDVTSSTFAEQNHISYDAFGKVLSGNPDRWTYTGRELDPLTALQFNHARWYDPAARRWTTRDPLGLDGDDSNPYRYAQNAPSNATDPSGLVAQQQTNEQLGLPGSTRLPSRDPADWTGAVGNSTFRPRRPADFGLQVGETIPFVGGRPDFSQFAVPINGPGSDTSFEVPDLGTGATARATPDRQAMVRRLATLRGQTQAQTIDWLSENRYELHHAGGTRTQILPRRINGIPHTGARSDNSRLPSAPRAGAAGALGRTAGRLNAFLSVRDACQIAGVLPPDQTVLYAPYYFTASDGSVYIVQDPSWYQFWGNRQRVYVAGPRSGQTESITSAEASLLQLRGEELYGRLVGGGLFEGPRRFIPGTLRRTLPIIEYDALTGRVRRIAGYVDETGEHRHRDNPLPGSMEYWQQYGG